MVSLQRLTELDKPLVAVHESGVGPLRRAHDGRYRINPALAGLLRLPQTSYNRSRHLLIGRGRRGLHRPIDRVTQDVLFTGQVAVEGSLRKVVRELLVAVDEDEAC
jgi:hypothetical protein